MSDNIILVSDSFQKLTQEQCSYEPASNVFIRGHGSILSHRLIGITTVESSPIENQPTSTKTDVSQEVEVKSKRKKCTIL